MSQTKSVMVRYKTHPDKADENAGLIRAVFDELRANKPAGLRYASYRLADGVSFVHIATHTTEGVHPLTSQPAFKAFGKDIASRCVEPPVTTEIFPLDRYDG
jgi:hypothetical protein